MANRKPVIRIVDLGSVDALSHALGHTTYGIAIDDFVPIDFFTRRDGVTAINLLFNKNRIDELTRDQLLEELEIMSLIDNFTEYVRLTLEYAEEHAPEELFRYEVESVATSNEIRITWEDGGRGRPTQRFGSIFETFEFLREMIPHIPASVLAFLLRECMKTNAPLGV